MHISILLSLLPILFFPSPSSSQFSDTVVLQDTKMNSTNTNKTGIKLFVGTGVDPRDVPIYYNGGTEPYFLLNNGQLNRVINANVFKSGKYSLFHSLVREKGPITPNQPTTSAIFLADVFSALNPTYISGMVMLGSTSYLLGSDIDDLQYMRAKIRRDNPGCLFDLHLNALEYIHNNGDALINKLTYIMNLIQSSKQKNAIGYLDFDIIFFDHFSQAFSKNPAVITRAIKFIHEEMNMGVGGNTYGGGIPPGSDLIQITTVAYKINMPSSKTNIPVIASICNSANNDLASEACNFVAYNMSKALPSNPWRPVTDATRLQIIESLAIGQSAGYSFAWPIFWPICPGLHPLNTLGTMAPGTTSATLYQYMNDTLIPKYSISKKSGIHTSLKRFPLNPKYSDTGAGAVIGVPESTKFTNSVNEKYEIGLGIFLGLLVYICV